MKTELLAPAGNQSKLETAFNYGADAVYIGGKLFSLRSFADNFTNDELKNAVDYAHRLNKKVYVTVNILARNNDFSYLKDYLIFLESINVDAAIISDPGIVYLAKKVAPNLKLHLSTQANTTNKYSVKFWHDIGVERVILARELSIAEIKEMKDFVPDVQLEAFVHGAMCISYSGRCLLSDYLDGRSSNRGACVQACRWNYEVRAFNPSNPDGEWLPMEEDERGTYILNSKDLNMSEHLKDLEDAGVSSFKIEGRMKSEYYLATIINAYRRGMDNGVNDIVRQELCNVAHREYTKAYAFGKNSKTVNYKNSQTKGDYKYIASIKGYENGFALVEMRNRFKSGDVLEILSPDDNFSKTFEVGEMYDSNNNLVDDAKLVQEIYKVKCPYTLKLGDFLRKKN